APPVFADPPPPAATPSSPPPPGRRPSPLAVGRLAPRFILQTLNPEAYGAVTFSTRRNVGPDAAEPKRALLLSFAASHCAPCRQELPEIAALAARFGGRGVATAVVVVDDEPAGVEAMRALLVDGLRFPGAVLKDAFSLVGRRYGAEVLPLNVVVDGEGRVAWFASGYAPEHLTAIEVALAELASPAAPSPEPAPSPER
ncbi:MAG: hypothetical protein CVU56_02590, partial [Deltaproteobacteria bacterium HGW-Deltaproteobacteria-14]